jgi:phenylalanyl-tRNA synthetase beta chain
MKFTLSWLKEHLETESSLGFSLGFSLGASLGASLDTITNALTRLGLVVAAVEDPSARWGAFRVAQIVSVAPHPQADRLQICSVQITQGEALGTTLGTTQGTDLLQIVCGASNARAGLKSILALPGDVIPETGQALKKGKIRGIESEGMLCAYEELLLGASKPEQAPEGIIEVEDHFPVGTPLLEVIGFNDPVIEIEVTPNRGDALGVRGIARDLAACGLGTLKPLPEPELGQGLNEALVIQQGNTLAILSPQAQQACPLFAACRIQGVRNGPSPAWLQARLKAVGLNPISALVDITNYLAYDLGRPLHVFDADRLQLPLTLGLSKAGDVLEALDDKSYTLPEGLLVIRDGGEEVQPQVQPQAQSQVQSLAGVMGASPSSCTLETTHVLLESAFFEPFFVGESGKATGIHSESRARFERGVDPALVLPGLRRAVALIQSLCGGIVQETWVTGAGIPQKIPPSLTLPKAMIEAVSGVKPDPQQVTSILETLGFSPVYHASSGGASEDGAADGASDSDAFWAIQVPSWRFDISLPQDLVEEVVRVLGYDHIPSTPLPLKPPIRPQAAELALGKMREILVSQGFFETVTWSFLSLPKAQLFGGGCPSLQLNNPISRELAVMRPSLFPHLLDLLGYHGKRCLPCSPVFEVGSSYHGLQPNDQRACLAGVVPFVAECHWKHPPAPDVFDLKAIVLGLLEAWGVNVKNLNCEASAFSWFHPGRQGVLKQGPKILASFGEFHPIILKAHGLSGRCGGFELYLDQLPPRKQASAKSPPVLSVYQPVTQDFAFGADASLPIETLVKTIEKAGGAFLTALQVFDIFEDAEVLGVGKKSVALRVTWQSPQGTLTEPEILALRTQLLAQVHQATGATLRDEGKREILV